MQGIDLPVSACHPEPERASFCGDGLKLLSGGPVDALAERLHRVLSEVFLVLGRRDADGNSLGELTLPQLSILMRLKECGPMRMTTLAAHERVRVPSASVAVRRLEKLQLVSRARDFTDMRAVIVEITPHGHDVYRDSLARRHAHLTAMLKSLSAADQAVLEKAVQPLAALGERDSCDEHDLDVGETQQDECSRSLRADMKAASDAAC